MSRSRRRKIPTELREADITDLSHDGRGVAHIDDKAVFIHGALPGEKVIFRYTECHRRFDMGVVEEVLEASPDRVEPRCPHFGVCGGCALQHLDPVRQIEFKQQTLMENLRRIGKVEPAEIWAPLTGPHWNYRRKARLSVRYVPKKDDRVLVGFREQYGRFVADCRECPILDQRFGDKLESLSELIRSLSIHARVPQLEVAAGDGSEQGASIIIRNLEDFTQDDLEKLREFATQSGLAVLLQAKGPTTIKVLEGSPEPDLYYELPEHQIKMRFSPSDFIQINAELNRKMINRAIELLQPDSSDLVLDLFCGLGNFSLALARHAGQVIGVEGDLELVNKARMNAELNQLPNANFFMADLNESPEQAAWLKPAYTKILLDPPRSGAEFILPHLAASSAKTILYISCHPASLARDAGVLVNEHGFSLDGAGVMDMFPHTAHVESIALFTRK
ncbi:MAG: 23S rRNA (uracil(1939)-C(5))-methyltransferase RlmD [Xanthomonadales bacterium]|nr:23S rRNA (uracil(1939)-C(5))-methyltransferase RlmD [Xanthomonadales bacterium]